MALLYSQRDDVIKIPNDRWGEITIEASKDNNFPPTDEAIMRKIFLDMIKSPFPETLIPKSKQDVCMFMKKGGDFVREPIYWMPSADDTKNSGFTFSLATNYFVKRVIFNEPATIVFWQDGSKTVVKCGPHDTYDPEKGFAMCFMKRFFGNSNRFHKLLKIAHKEIEKQNKTEE